jgi:DNA-binding MarR family transcriptional regulator
MTGAQREQLNEFFVKTFNSILTLEERALSGSGAPLSVREMHVIEAVSTLEKQRLNTMSAIAGMLGISVGALTTSVSTLIRKGYLIRGSDPSDRRVVLVFPTDAGRAADAQHSAFHSDMLDQVEKVLSGEDIERLTRALSQLTHFFKQYDGKGRE